MKIKSIKLEVLLLDSKNKLVTKEDIFVLLEDDNIEELVHMMYGCFYEIKYWSFYEVDDIHISDSVIRYRAIEILSHKL